MDKIVMIEAGANEVDEDTMLTAIKTAHVEIKKIIEFINKIVAERGKPKIDFQVVGLDMDVFHAIQNKYLDDFKAAMDTDDKNVRDAALLPIMDKIAEEYPDLSAADLDLVSYKMQKFVVRRWLLDEGKRVDGRGINEIRPLAAEVGILPRVHGSGMFTRGQTQVLTTCTLGGTKDNRAAPAAARSVTVHWPSVLWCRCCPLWRSSPTPSAACPRCSALTAPPLRLPSAALRWH